MDRRYQIQTLSPDGGNQTPMRQGRVSARILLVRVRLVEVVGGCVFRTQVNHRKANSADKLVISGEVQNPFVAEGVLVAGCDIRSIILTQGSRMGPCYYNRDGKLKGRKDR
jgi:hypothetical protein